MASSSSEGARSEPEHFLARRKYPGLHLPIRHLAERSYPNGSHDSSSEFDPLPVRELAMLSIMERLTNKQDWHKKVFSESIVAKWREEAFAIPDREFRKLATFSKKPFKGDEENEGNDYTLITAEDGDIVLAIDEEGLFNKGHDNVYNDCFRVGPALNGIMSDTTFDAIIQELRDKAVYYERTGLIPTLDACAAVIKSDTLISEELHHSLQQAFNRLITDSSNSTDWHPGSNDLVRNLVHPCLYPLVYGRSRVLNDDAVGVTNAIGKWAGKGDIIAAKGSNERDVSGIRRTNASPDFWSETYQWLPANVDFRGDGSVKFSSYINSLHPLKYAGIYRVVEKLIETTLPAWDQCLAERYGCTDAGAGITASRFPKADKPDDENPANWIPSGPEEVAHVEVNWDEVNRRYGLHRFKFYDAKRESDMENEKKWELLRRPVIPEPVYEKADYDPKDGTRLSEKFASSGLQIIVKMASVELTPEKPEFPVGGWHLEGQMNEHICATALYYLDSENITDSSLSFRMRTSMYLDDKEGFHVGQNSYSWLEQIYGTKLGVGDSPCLQNYGSVETSQGRLVVFPNVFQHRVSSFRLIDPARPGHRRFIALWLVDPHQRIISTANVPPQQRDWWIESLLGKTREAQIETLSKLSPEIIALIDKQGLEAQLTDAKDAKLPPELMDMVREYFNDEAFQWLMTIDEAKEHRERLMDERSAFVQKSGDEWCQTTYSFCEH